MLFTVVALAVIAAGVAGPYAWRARQRRFDDRTPYIPSHPFADRNDRYGGWDAGAYDSDSHHGSSATPQPRTPDRPAPSMTQQPWGRR